MVCAVYGVSLEDARIYGKVYTYMYTLKSLDRSIKDQLGLRLRLEQIHHLSSKLRQMYCIKEKQSRPEPSP